MEETKKDEANDVLKEPNHLYIITHTTKRGVVVSGQVG